MHRDIRRLEALIGRVLIAGVMAAGVIVALGGILYLYRHAGTDVYYRLFTGEPTDLTTIGGVLGDALRASGRGIIQLGLIVLVAVQVVRVAFTVWLFKAMGDSAFVAISLAVLGVLVYSLFGQG